MAKANVAEMDVAFVEEAFEYLDELRESGATNMFGARPYLIEEFALTGAEASALLSAWMHTYSDTLPPADRAANAVAAA